MKPKIIDGQTMQSISECRAWFVHCGRSFLPSVMYKSLLTKIIEMSGSIFRASSHFCNASTDAVCLPRPPSWLHWYRWCIVSRSRPQRRQRLFFACHHCSSIVMVEKVLLIHFFMKDAMWKVVLSCACLNYMRSITHEYSMWVRFQSAQYWINRRLGILYTID